MTQILTDDLLTKVAVYWPPGTINEDGERGAGTPQELPCHWEDRHIQAITPDGKEFITSAVVFLSSSVEVGGWLWLSSATVKDDAGTALAEAPSDPPYNRAIKSNNMVPDIDNEETLYRAYL